MTSKLIERLINKEYLTERERKEWLNAIKERLEVLENENEKLKKAIEILKKFNFKLEQYYNGEYYILIYYAGITIEIILIQQEYKLLEEVLDE